MSGPRAAVRAATEPPPYGPGGFTSRTWRRVEYALLAVLRHLGTTG
ncbi:hypothetical protein ACFWBR_37700 [Streptomyces sp. NPDC060006]